MTDNLNLKKEKELLVEELMDEYVRDFNTDIPQIRGDRLFWYLFNEAYLPIIEWIISKVLKVPIAEVRKNKVRIPNARLPLLHKKDKGKYTDLLVEYKGDKYLFELNNRFNGIGTRFLVYGANEIVGNHIMKGQTIEDALNLKDEVTFENPSRITIYNLDWHSSKKKAKKLKPKSKSFLDYNEYNPEDKLVTNYYINLDYYENLSYNEVKEEDKFFKLLTFKTMKELEDAVKADKDLKCYLDRFKMFLNSEEREAYMFENYDLYCKKCDDILEGVMRGREQGYDLGRQEIIMNMHANNMSLDVISKATKLPIEEIKEIIKTNKNKMVDF